jgi:hypothetical protein
MMRIECRAAGFDIHIGMTLGYHIGGRTEWRRLVTFLDG